MIGLMIVGRVLLGWCAAGVATAALYVGARLLARRIHRNNWPI